MITEMAIVMANCWYKRPVIPGINAVGTNTAARLRAMAMTDRETSSMALNAASRGDMPCVIWGSSGSAPTIAATTSGPIANERPKAHTVVREHTTDEN